MIHTHMRTGGIACQKRSGIKYQSYYKLARGDIFLFECFHVLFDLGEVGVAMQFSCAPFVLSLAKQSELSV